VRSHPTVELTWIEALAFQGLLRRSDVLTIPHAAHAGRLDVLIVSRILALNAPRRLRVLIFPWRLDVLIPPGRLDVLIPPGRLDILVVAGRLDILVRSIRGLSSPHHRHGRRRGRKGTHQS